MKINLSQKNKIVIIILLVLVLGGTGGYLLWRVNQDDTLAEVPGLAANCSVKCTGPCVAGTPSDSRAGCGKINGVQQVCPYTVTCTHSCGDATCDSDETATSCPSDCTKCGDKLCTGSETLASCPGDCAVCGDKVCTSPTETLALCPGDCAVCGDSICTAPTENSTTCASDCACKAMVWSNKPSGSYKPNSVATISPITITNSNSTSTTTTGIVIKLNGTTLTQCGNLTGASCFTLSNDSAKQQIVTIALFGGQPVIAEGTYVLSVTLPGASDSCAESASFTIAEDAVVVPDTGIFDGVMGKIYLGTGFVFLGIVTTQFSKFSYALSTFGGRIEKRVTIANEERRKKREEDKRNRFERRFK